MLSASSSCSEEISRMGGHFGVVFFRKLSREPETLTSKPGQATCDLRLTAFKRLGSLKLFKLVLPDAI